MKVLCAVYSEPFSLWGIVTIIPRLVAIWGEKVCLPVPTIRLFFAVGYFHFHRLAESAVCISFHTDIVRSVAEKFTARFG